MLILTIFSNKLRDLILVSSLLFVHITLISQPLYDVEWDPNNFINCIYSPPGSDFLVNTGTPDWGSSGAPSLNVIASGTSGELSYKIANMSDVQIGLSYNSFSPNPNSISFSFRLEQGRLYAYEGNMMKVSIGGYVVNRFLQIKRVGSTIYYYYNNFEVYRTSYNPNVPLIASVALRNSNSIIGLVEISAQAPTPPPTPIEIYYHPATKTLGGGCYTVNDNMLRVTIVDKHGANSSFSYRIYKSSPNEAPNYTSINKAVGDNRLNIDVASLSAGIYIFEVKNDIGEKYFLKFKK